MNNQLTPAQIKVIETWTEKRDILLREVGVLESQKNELRKELTEGGQSLADIHNQIEFAKGRLTELNNLEQRHKDSVSTEILELEVRKTRLEGEIKVIETKIEDADSRLNLELIVTKDLSDTHMVMKDQAAIVNRVVGEIIQTSQTHTSEMKEIMTEIRTVSAQVIEKGNENVKQTGIILEKLPRYIFELQKPIPIRRAYATPKGTIIHPEKLKE